MKRSITHFVIMSLALTCAVQARAASEVCTIHVLKRGSSPSHQGALTVPTVAGGEANAVFDIPEEHEQVRVSFDSETLREGLSNFTIILSDTSQGYGKYVALAGADTLVSISQSASLSAWNQDISVTADCRPESR